MAAALFDLDGVLVDSRRPIAQCINHALEREGLAPEPEAALHGFIGPPLRDCFAALLAARGRSEDRVASCIGHYRERYREVAPTETPAFPGIAACLEALAPRLPLAVATSKPEAFARPILESLGLARHFRAIVGPPLRETHAEDKTRTVARALAAFAPAAPGTPVAMIGDRHFDVRAGAAHALLTIGVTWGIGDEAELREAGADLLVASPFALRELLLGGSGEPGGAP